MTVNYTFLETSHGLLKKYLIITFLALSVFLTLIATYKTYNLINHEILNLTRNIDKKLSDIYYKKLNYLHHVGDQLIPFDVSQDNIPNILHNNYVIPVGLPSDISYNIVGFINEKNDFVTGPPFLMIEQIQDMVNISKNHPWEMLFGDIQTPSSNLSFSYMPLIMTIVDDYGNYKGTLISILQCDEVHRALEPQNHNFIVKTVQKGDQIYNNDVHTNSFFNRIFNYSRIPLKVNIKYSKSSFIKEILISVLPAIGALLIACTILVIMSFLYKDKILLPFVNKLRLLLEEETKSRKRQEENITRILSKVPGIIYSYNTSSGVAKIEAPNNEVDSPPMPLNISIGELVKCLNSHIKNTKLINNNSYEITHPIHNIENRKLWVLNYGTTNENNIYEGVMVDITQLKNSEENLKKSNKDLEQFARICSHDLKEPLRTIYSYISLIKDNNIKKFDEESKKFFSFVEQDTLRLKELIDSILVYSKLNVSEKKEQVSVESIFTSVTSLLTTLLEETNTQIKYEGDDYIFAETKSIQRVFMNIISNSIKFCDQDTPVIEVTSSTNNGVCQISFKDNGIGIEEEYQKSIFELFSRINSKDKFEGAGIGLSICKKIVERNNGNISVSSKIGLGSIFVVSLPSAD